jgi:hypothetical protein
MAQQMIAEVVEREQPKLIDHLQEQLESLYVLLGNVAANDRYTERVRRAVEAGALDDAAEALERFDAQRARVRNLDTPFARRRMKQLGGIVRL